MTTKKTDQQPEAEMSVEQWLAIRKDAGRHIDPETAEVFWTYIQVLESVWYGPRSSSGMSVHWSRIFRPFSRERYLGFVR